MTVASVEIFAVEGNRQWLDGGAMFGNAPRVVWEKWAQPDQLGRIPLACRALLAKINDQYVLCETGIGAFFDPKMSERFGVENPSRHRLLESLTALGLSATDIDYVILSHLHFDHAGGLLPTFAEINSGNNQLLFPKAQYVVGQEAWARARHPHARDRASFIPSLNEKLENSGRLVLVEGASHPKVLPKYISFIYSSGHTPGQMHTVIRGNATPVIFAGDLVPGQAWVPLPITMGYDRNPELLIDEKQKLYERAVPESWWVFFTHDPQVAMAKIQLADGRFRPVETQTEVTKFYV